MRMAPVASAVPVSVPDAEPDRGAEIRDGLLASDAAEPVQRASEVLEEAGGACIRQVCQRIQSGRIAGDEIRRSRRLQHRGRQQQDDRVFVISLGEQELHSDVGRWLSPDLKDPGAPRRVQTPGHHDFVADPDRWSPYHGAVPKVDPR